MSLTTEQTDVIHEKKKSIDDYKITKKLGQGSEGNVYLAHDSEGRKVALKSIVCHSEEESKKLVEELEFLITLKHPHIVEHITFFDKPHKTFTGIETKFFLVMEYCSGGSLEDYIVQRKKKNEPFESEILLSWIRQLASCMLFLHDKGILHRDIKSENILLSEDLKTVKVCDFGFTKKTAQLLTGTVLGTVVYMAPEIFENKRYDVSVDIWSLGIVILQLLLLEEQSRVPDVRVELLKDENYVRNLLKGKDEKIASIAIACLKIEPSERPTGDEIIKFIDDENAKTLDQDDPSEKNDDDQIIDIKNVDPMHLLKSKKANEFWRANGWENKPEVEWSEFKEAYAKYMGYKRMNKEQGRGFRRLLCYTVIDETGKKKQMTSCVKLNQASAKAGFPFSNSILASIERYSKFSGDTQSKKNYNTPQSYAEKIKARDEYLQIILDHDSIFVDPITQETLSIDQHCAPLRLLTEEECETMMTNEFDMDYEDDRMLRLERLGQRKMQKPQHEDAVNFLINVGNQKFIILGAAASGKTCLMRLLLYKAAEKAKEELQKGKKSSPLIPILCPIATLSSFEKDMDFKLKIIRACADCLLHKAVKFPDHVEHFLWTCMKENNALILLDGLDEAADLDLKRDIQHSICHLPPENGIIITSRVSGFECDDEGRTLFEDYQLAKIQPLSFDTQKQIAAKRGVTDESFISALQGKYSELAKTPLLLSLMIGEFKESNSLPEVRSELYGQAVNTMIKLYFQKERPNQKASETEVEIEKFKQFLCALSKMLHEKRQRDFVDEDVTGDEAFMKQWKEIKPKVDEGKFSLIIVINGKYRFSHLSFQEYFVATLWANSNIESDIRVYENVMFGLRKQLTFATERIKKLIIDSWYRETFLLCAGAMSQDDFKKFANFLFKIFKRQGGLIDSILYNMIRERPESERDLYIGIQKQMNSERKLRTLMEGLVHYSDDLRQVAIRRIKLYKNNKTLNRFLMKHLSDDNDYAAEAMTLVIPKGNVDMIQRLLDEGLKSKDVKVVRRSCIVLGDLAGNGNENVRNELLKLMMDPEKDPKTKRCAAQAIALVAKKGDKEVIQQFIEMMKDYNYRDIAAMGLGILAEKGNEEAIQSLFNISNICQEALESLGKLGNPGDKRIMDTLLNGLSRQAFDEKKIAVALKTICQDDTEYVVDKLITMIQKSEKKLLLAQRAAIVLGDVVPRGQPDVVNRLLQSLYNTKNKNKDKAALALGYTAKKGDKRIIKKLIELLDDTTSHFSVREKSAVALGIIAPRGHKLIIERLLAHVHDTEEVCLAVTNALIDVVDQGNKEVIDEFIKLLSHPDTGMVQKAVVVLGKVGDVGDEKIINALKKLLISQNTTEHVKTHCIASLGVIAKSNDATVVSLLTEKLKDGSEQIKLAILTALSKLITKHSEKIAELLLDLLKNDVESVKQEAIRVLAKVGNIDYLIEQFKNLKEMRPILFSVIVTAIRTMREKDPLFQLSESSVKILQNIRNSLESEFILLENAGGAGGK